MSCSEYRRHLPDYADDALASPLRERTAAHLAGCPACRVEVDAWRALRSAAAAGHAAIRIPPGLAGRIAASIGHAHKPVTRPPRIVSTARARILIAGLCAAASIGFTAVVAYRTFWVSPYPGNPRPALDASLAAFSPDVLAQVYERCACQMQHNELLQGDGAIQAEKDRLCASRKFAVLLPNLEPLGYRLAGICECPKDQKMRVVHAFYRATGDAAQFLSIFSFPQRVRFEACNNHMGQCGKKDKRTYEVYRDEPRHVVLLKWDENKCSYALCSNLSQDQLQSIADQMKVAIATAETPRVAGR